MTPLTSQFTLPEWVPWWVWPLFGLIVVPLLRWVGVEIVKNYVAERSKREAARDKIIEDLNAKVDGQAQQISDLRSDISYIKGRISSAATN